jgi:hypothetical protein
MISCNCVCFIGNEGVRIPCCAHCIQMQHSILCTYLGELSHSILKHHFAVIKIFEFTWYRFVLNNIEGVMIPCLCTLYFNSNGIGCAQTLGSFFILCRALFWSYHNIFIWFAFWIFWLLSSFVGSLSIVLFSFQSFDPQYSLISPNILSLTYACVFTLIFFGAKHTFGEELSLYWPSKHFCPFWQWMPDVYACFFSCRQCWASKCRGL